MEGFPTVNLSKDRGQRLVNAAHNPPRIIIVLNLLKPVLRVPSLTATSNLDNRS